MICEFIFSIKKNKYLVTTYYLMYDVLTNKIEIK